MNARILIILTLKKHEGGIWIRRLVERLHTTAEHHNIQVRKTTSDEPLETEESNKKESNDGSKISGNKVSIRVQSLEEWLSQGWIVSTDCFANVVGIVNRVSDAASPPLFKACIAVLESARLSGIPIFNGPTTYALCGNKWCHHVLFHRAGLQAPATLATWNEGAANANDNQHFRLDELVESGVENNDTLLIKPNSGGFGAGIQRITSPIEEPLPVFDDCITLVQRYHTPREKKIYRVWFLQGRVQCAVVRHISVDEGIDEFTNACSGTCALQKPPIPWKVAVNVREEIEQQLLPLLADAHCGSVEFLCSEDGSRLYFDLNLLSTLPTQVAKTKEVWSDGYDPWAELAGAVWITILG